MNESLAQFVANAGGVCLTDPALQGELDRVRYLNRALRGRNSVLRPSGRPFDIMANDCIDAGYPITEGDFLEALEADAFAWADGNSRHRVYIDLELSDSDLELFDCEYESWLIERAHMPVCAVCDAPTGATYTRDGEMLCADCHRWAQGLTGEFEGCISMPASELGTETGAALESALRILLTHHYLLMVG